MSKNKYCAVVTGGTRGIGYAIAERLIEDGMDVIVTGTSKDALEIMKLTDFIYTNSRIRHA